jgi:hypothetical protein
VAATILAQLLQRSGIASRLVSYQAIGSSAYGSLDLDGVGLICLSYMNPSSLAHARYAIRRLRRLTHVPILVGIWSPDAAALKSPDVIAATRSDLSATSLQQAIEEIERALSTAANSPGLVAEAGV